MRELVRNITVLARTLVVLVMNDKPLAAVEHRNGGKSAAISVIVWRHEMGKLLVELGHRQHGDAQVFSKAKRIQWRRFQQA